MIVHGAANQCLQTGTADMDIIAMAQLLAKEKLCRWTTTDITNANNKDMLEHVTGALLPFYGKNGSTPAASLMI